MIKTILLSVFALSLLAEVPDKAAPPRLNDAQRAKLYKLLAESAAAQANAQAAQANAQVKSDAFKAEMSALEKFCGAPVVEQAGQMADCPAPVAPAKEMK